MRAFVPAFFHTLFLILAATSHAHAQQPLRGVVVDQSGQVLPRALVRVVDATGREMAATFADEAGRFRIAAAIPCRVEASLTGFKSAEAECAETSPMRLALAVAPIHETMIVSATRTEAPTSQIGASATIFTTDDLERRQRPLIADLLTSTPGAMVVRSGGPGALTSLFVRGGESDYNKVLLDGVPLNEPGGSFYLNNLTSENLERVEVVRGAYSSLFGSDAMASVIQLVTKAGDGVGRRPRVNAQVDGGTYATRHVSAGVSGATRRLDYSIGAADFNSDNRVPNSRLDNTTLSTNVGVALGNGGTLRFVARGELEHVGTPGPTAFGRPDLDAFFERRDGTGSVSFNQQTTDRFRQRVSYSLASSHQQSTNLILDPPYTATFNGQTALFRSNDFRTDSRNRLVRHHAGYQADLRLTADPARGDHRLTMLVDWDGERATAENRLSNARTVNSRDNFGLAAQEQMLWRRVFVTVGGRVEHNESFGSAVVPRASVVYVAHPASDALGETKVKINAGMGIKEPTMLESFSVSPFFLGNPDLEPERSRSVEGGIEQRFARDRAKLELTYFHNRFSDIISLVTTNPSTFEAQYANVGVTRARGLEAVIQAAPVPAVRLRGGYTLLDSKIVQSVSPNDRLFGLGRPAFRRPHHSGFAGVGVEVNRLSADVNGVFIGAFADSDFGLFNPALMENPGHHTWDARAALRMTPQLSATLAIDNLTNQDYSAPFGYQPLLRVVRAGLRVGF